MTHGVKTFRLAKGKSDEIAKVLREMLGVEDSSSSSSSYRSSSYYRSRYSRSSSSQPAKAKVTSAVRQSMLSSAGHTIAVGYSGGTGETLEKMERPEASVMEVVHLEKAEAASVADAVNRALQGGAYISKFFLSKPQKFYSRVAAVRDEKPEVT